MQDPIEPIYLKNFAGGCWPTKQQELLLRAALLENTDAIYAWHEWQSISDFDDLDPGSFRLLPLVYRNLSKFGLNGPVKNKLKGTYRLAWYNNHMLFSKIAALLASFRDAGLPTIILKGAALTISCYKDYGVRPMQDFDFLVKTEQARAAMSLLRKLGNQATNLRKSIFHIAIQFLLPGKMVFLWIFIGMFCMIAAVKIQILIFGIRRVRSG